MKLFAQIQKVDEEKRLVYGRAADETVDKSDEALNYDGSKPHFQKWSANIAKDTDGKNLGNVRAMHGKVAVGKLTDMAFDDAAKTIDVCAKIVDDNEWKKVMEGVYTGFSIGGAYGAKSVEKIADKSVTRYIAIPNEISLVDRPCIPTAKFFEVQKADGTLAKVEFQKSAEDIDVEVEGTADQVEELGKLMLEKNMSLAQVLELVKGDAKTGDDVSKSTSDDEYMKNLHDGLAAKSSDQEKAMLTDAHNAYLDSDCMSKGDFEGHPFRGNQYQSGTSGDAVNKSMKAHGHETASAHRSAAASHRAAAKSAANAGHAKTAAYHQKMAAFHSSRAGAIKVDDVAMDDALVKLETAMTDALEKVGARNNATDKARIEAIHAAAVELGATCGVAEKIEPAADLTKIAPDAEALAKIVADAVAPMQKALADAAEKIAKLEAQPAHPRVSLRAVSKAADNGDETPKVTEADLVKDASGAVHPAASLIKQALQTGGQPLHYRG